MNDRFFFLYFYVEIIIIHVIFQFYSKFQVKALNFHFLFIPRPSIINLKLFFYRELTRIFIPI